MMKEVVMCSANTGIIVQRIECNTLEEVIEVLLSKLNYSYEYLIFEVVGVNGKE